MKAILVSVDYADLLRVTLPYNRHHFDDVMVVTSLADVETVACATHNQAEVFQTNAFYEDGATFNKWKALEQGLDEFGRDGWLCIMDADVLWPKSTGNVLYQRDRLYTPLCRFINNLSGVELPPPEATWGDYPMRPNPREFAGYTQIFHCDDEHLPKAPWHEINWKHAGGADSFFQRLWPDACKIRPAWEALHLGPHGTNWCGRATPYLDGREPEGATKKIKQLLAFRKGRRRAGSDPYAGEKIN